MYILLQSYAGNFFDVLLPVLVAAKMTGYSLQRPSVARVVKLLGSVLMATLLYTLCVRTETTIDEMVYLLILLLSLKGLFKLKWTDAFHVCLVSVCIVGALWLGLRFFALHFLLPLEDMEVFQRELLLRGICTGLVGVLLLGLPLDRLFGLMTKKPLLTKRILFNLFIFLFLLILSHRMGALLPSYLIFALLPFLILLNLLNGLLYESSSLSSKEKSTGDARFMEVFNESIARLRNRLHEEKNRTQAISMLPNMFHTHESLSAAIAEYTKVSGENKYLSRFLDIKRPFVSALIASKVMDAENLGIRVEVELGDYGLAADIDDYHLSEIFGILIDNAVEAVQERAQDQEPEMVLVRIYRQYEALVIEVSNACPLLSDEVLQRLFKKGYSTKKGSDRGLGLYSLRRIVEDFNASVLAFNRTTNGKNHIVFKVMF